MKTVRKVFFSEEKKQKTFIFSARPTGPAMASLVDGRRTKSLLVLFFRKEHACLLLSLFAFAARAEDVSGSAIFNERCALCHQADAHGSPGVAPSLAGTLARYTGCADGIRYLSQIVLSGMVGKIQTEGHSFSGLMPSFSGDFSDAQIAAVVDYVLAKYNGLEKPVITAADVAQARAANPVATQTRHLREKILAGGS
jgi:mono/diheme cytochrome c family protein